jgi:hypothetical protein
MLKILRDWFGPRRRPLRAHPDTPSALEQSFAAAATAMDGALRAEVQRVLASGLTKKLHGPHEWGISAPPLPDAGSGFRSRPSFHAQTMDGNALLVECSPNGLDLISRHPVADPGALVITTLAFPPPACGGEDLPYWTVFLDDWQQGRQQLAAWVADLRALGMLCEGGLDIPHMHSGVAGYVAAAAFVEIMTPNENVADGLAIPLRFLGDPFPSVVFNTDGIHTVIDRVIPAAELVDFMKRDFQP